MDSSWIELKSSNELLPHPVQSVSGSVMVINSERSKLDKTNKQKTKKKTLAVLSRKDCSNDIFAVSFCKFLFKMEN
jgi:hypothetical protein